MFNFRIQCYVERSKCLHVETVDSLVGITDASFVICGPFASSFPCETRAVLRGTKTTGAQYKVSY